MAITVRHQEVIRRRLERFFLIVALGYVALIGRLIFLQGVKGHFFDKRAEMARMRTMAIPAERGSILDRGGVPLATTTHSGTLVCDPTLVTDPDAASRAVGELLGMSPSQVAPLIARRDLANGRPCRRAVVADHLNYTAIDAITTKQATPEGKAALRGFAITDETERTYPCGTSVAHVVGFLGSNGSGAMGIEASQDRLLGCKDGFMKVEVDARQRVIPDSTVQRVAPTDGKTVKLALDAYVQRLAETELSRCVEAYHPVGATAIVMEPKTGDVLAMVSLPTFDPANRKGLKAPFEPLRNRAVTPFEPGSTMKIVTAAAALEDKVISPSTTFYCNGTMKLNNRTIRCSLHGDSERYGHGTETIREIIEHSCNVGTAEIGLRIGMDRMANYLERFGMLGRTHVGLNEEARGRLGGDTGNARRARGKLARVAFGQSVMVTPLAMASAYAAIANNGLLMKPRLILSSQDDEGRTIEENAPQQVRQAVSPATAAFLKEMLVDVVTKGTGKSAAVPGYTVAGKTGTAQKVSPGGRGYASGKYVASFIGFLPASAPRVVVYVVVDEPQGGYYGAEVAAPVFQRIARQLMYHWQVPPDDPASLHPANVAAR